MMNGQKGVKYVRMVELEIPLRQKTVGYEVLVGENYTFWDACCAGREKNSGDVGFHSRVNIRFFAVQIVNINAYASLERDDFV
jgi:hypothetical protein